MSYANLLNMTCTLRSKSTTIDATTGGNKTAWNNAATLVRCTIQANNISASSSREDQIAMRETGLGQFWAWFPFSTTIKTGYRITTIAGGSFAASDILEVMGPPVDDGGRGVVWKVPCRTAKLDSVEVGTQ